MSRTSPWKCKYQVQIKSGIKKVRKEYLQETTVVFPSRFRGINSHATWGNTWGDLCNSSAMCCTSYKEKLGVANSTFDGGWVTRWWQDVGGGAENKGVNCEPRRGWKSRSTWRCYSRLKWKRNARW